MLTFLAEYLTQFYSWFNVFSYVTFRAILSLMTALIFCLIFGPKIIDKLQKYQVGQVVRDDGPKTHESKNGTPTMGGILILAGIFFSVLLWGDLRNKYVWVLIFVLFSFGGIGFFDDYLKVIRKNTKGLISRWKYLLQSVFALIIAVYLYITATPVETQLVVPFIKDLMPQLGVLFIVITYFTIVGSSNAVNLTDGLDGLAITPTVMVAVALGIIAYLSGHSQFSGYLHIPYIKGIGELVIVCTAMAGAGIGFLWFNTYPAQIFMGDVGSLSLGAALGAIAVLVRQEIVLFIMGGVFVMRLCRLYCK